MKKTHLMQTLRADRPGLDWPGWSLAFLVCSFVGWVFETTVVWRQTGKFTNRGYLSVLYPADHYFPALQGVPALGNLPAIFGLPIIEMYGFGAVIIIATMHGQRHHPVRIFCIGSVLMTLFELASSYLCTFALHHEFWNYSTDFLNFDGRICLRSSIAWGMLSLLAIEVLDPFVDRIYAHERGRRVFKVAMALLMGYAALCAVLKYGLAPGLFPPQP